MYNNIINPLKDFVLIILYIIGNKIYKISKSEKYQKSLFPFMKKDNSKKFFNNCFIDDIPIIE